MRLQIELFSRINLVIILAAMVALNMCSAVEVDKKLGFERRQGSLPRNHSQEVRITAAARRRRALAERRCSVAWALRRWTGKREKHDDLGRTHEVTAQVARQALQHAARAPLRVRLLANCPSRATEMEFSEVESGERSQFTVCCWCRSRPRGASLRRGGGCAKKGYGGTVEEASTLSPRRLWTCGREPRCERGPGLFAMRCTLVGPHAQIPTMNH